MNGPFSFLGDFFTHPVVVGTFKILGVGGALSAALAVFSFVMACARNNIGYSSFFLASNILGVLTVLIATAFVLRGVFA